MTPLTIRKNILDLTQQLELSGTCFVDAHEADQRGLTCTSEGKTSWRASCLKSRIRSSVFRESCRLQVRQECEWLAFPAMTRLSWLCPSQSASCFQASSTVHVSIFCQCPRPCSSCSHRTQQCLYLWHHCTHSCPPKGSTKTYLAQAARDWRCKTW